MQRPVLERVIAWKLSEIDTKIKNASSKIQQIVDELALYPERADQVPYVLGEFVRQIREGLIEKEDLTRPRSGNVLHQWAIATNNLLDTIKDNNSLWG